MPTAFQPNLTQVMSHRLPPGLPPSIQNALQGPGGPPAPPPPPGGSSASGPIREQRPLPRRAEPDNTSGPQIQGSGAPPPPPPGSGGSTNNDDAETPNNNAIHLNATAGAVWYVTVSTVDPRAW